MSSLNHLYRIYDGGALINEIVSKRSPDKYKSKILYEFKKSYKEPINEKLTIKHVESNDNVNVLTALRHTQKEKEHLLPSYLNDIETGDPKKPCPNKYDWTRSNVSHIRRIVKDVFNGSFSDDIYDLNNERLLAYFETLDSAGGYLASIQKALLIKYEYQLSVIKNVKFQVFNPDAYKLDNEKLQTLPIVQEIARKNTRKDPLGAVIQTIHTQTIPARVGVYENLYTCDNGNDNYLNIDEGVIIARKFKNVKRKGTQRIPLPDIVRTALKKYIVGQRRQKRECIKLFTNYNDSVQRLTGYTSNKLRHLYATQGLEAGFDPTTIAFYMNTSSNMILNTYRDEPTAIGDSDDEE